MAIVVGNVVVLASRPPSVPTLASMSSRLSPVVIITVVRLTGAVAGLTAKAMRKSPSRDIYGKYDSSKNVGFAENLLSTEGLHMSYDKEMASPRLPMSYDEESANPMALDHRTATFEGEHSQHSTTIHVAVRALCSSTHDLLFTARRLLYSRSQLAP